MRHTLETLNISHVTTSYYHPQANFKVERFHRALHNVMSKKVSDNTETWDLHLNHVLAAIRFNTNESTKFSAFYLLYNHGPVLPIDNILKPRRKYLGEEPHKIAIEQQHKSFIMVHQNLKRAKKRQAKYADGKVSTLNSKLEILYISNNKSAKASYREDGVLTTELLKRLHLCLFILRIN